MLIAKAFSVILVYQFHISVLFSSLQKVYKILVDNSQEFLELYLSYGVEIITLENLEGRSSKTNSICIAMVYKKTYWRKAE